MNRTNHTLTEINSKMSNKDLTFGLFLRIDTKNFGFANSLVSILSKDKTFRTIKSTLHKPADQKHVPPYNSNDIVVSVDNLAETVQEIPSKGKVLRCITTDQEYGPEILKLFNIINLKEPVQSNFENKPTFSQIIKDKFVPPLFKDINQQFLIFVDTKNPQVLVGNKQDYPFEWYVIHDEYTVLLIATTDVSLKKEFLSIPGSNLFNFALPDANYCTVFHPVFLTQKFRRSARSCAEAAGKFRAITGIEEYLIRLTAAQEPSEE